MPIPLSVNNVTKSVLTQLGLTDVTVKWVLSLMHWIATAVMTLMSATHTTLEDVIKSREDAKTALDHLHAFAMMVMHSTFYIKNIAMMLTSVKKIMVDAHKNV